MRGFCWYITRYIYILLFTVFLSSSQSRVFRRIFPETFSPFSSVSRIPALSSSSFGCFHRIKNLGPVSFPHGGSPSHSSSSSVSSGCLFFNAGPGSTCGSEALNQSVSSQRSSHELYSSGDPAAIIASRSTKVSDQMAGCSLRPGSTEPARPSPLADIPLTTGVMHPPASQISITDTLTQHPDTISNHQFPSSNPESGSVLCFQVIEDTQVDDFEAWKIE